MKLITKTHILYIIMICIFIITIFIINLIVTFPRDWKKEYEGILYDTMDKTVYKELNIKLEGKYKKSPLNGEETFIGDIYINGESIFHQDKVQQRKFRVGGGFLDSRFIGKYYDDNLDQELYIFLMAYVDDRSQLVMRLYERVNEDEITFSNKIIAAPASNRQEAQIINKYFSIGEPLYIKYSANEDFSY